MKRIKPIIFSCVILYVFSAHLSAEQNQKILTLDIKDAVNLAIDNNVSLKESRITLNAAKRARNDSWNSISPTASLGASYTLPTSGDSNYDYTYSLSGTVSASLSANLYTSIWSAKVSYESGKITFDDAVRTLEKSVRQSFYGLLYEKENIELQEKNMENARQTYVSNKTKYDQGRLSELDVLSAETTYKGYIPTVENARVVYQNDIAAFNQLLGLDINQEVTLKGDLDDAINIKAISLDGISVKSSAVQKAELAVKSAKAGVLDKRFTAYAPSLSATWKYSDTTTSKESGKTTADSSTLTLSATIPLDGVLPWSVRNDNVDTAKDTLKKAELELEDAKTDLQVSIDSSMRTINQSMASVKSKQANVELAQRTYDMTKQAYDRGTKDLLSLQSAMNSLLTAQLALKNESYTLIKNILTLESTIGVPFGTFGIQQ